MDYKGRMDTYAIDSFSNLPGEVVPAIRQRGVNFIGILNIIYIYIYISTLAKPCQ